MKFFISTVLKLGVAAGLIYWLIASGKLHFGELRIFTAKPETFVYNCLLWLFCFVLLGAFRWYLLLRGQSLEVGFWRTVRLQLIGFFFNTAMPGAVGGDIIKAVYVIKEQRDKRRTPAMLTILLDRVVGLVSLFCLAGIALAVNFEVLWRIQAIQGVAVFIAICIALLIAGCAVVFYPFKEGRDPFLSLLSRPWPGFRILKSIYEAMRSYRDKPFVLLSALAVSVIIQGANLWYAWYMTKVITGVDPDFWIFSTVYPVGLMTTAIPLAPGGLGVGHVAFERLYHLAGWTGGANVFNVLVLGQLCLHMLGVIPYLMHRVQLPDPDHLGDELEAVMEQDERGDAQTPADAGWA